MTLEYTSDAHPGVPTVGDVEALPVKYRVGRKNGHTIYLGGQDPDDGDVWVGCARTKGMAHTLVELANVGLAAMNRNLSTGQLDALKSMRDLREVYDQSQTPDEPGSGG